MRLPFSFRHLLWIGIALGVVACGAGFNHAMNQQFGRAAVEGR